MKIAIRERSWVENMALVFQISWRMFVPLFLLSLLIGLPAFVLHYWSWVHAEWTDGGPWVNWGYRSPWAWFLDLLEIPIRQAVCLSLVARGFEGGLSRSRSGWVHVLSCIPSLMAVLLLTTLALGFAFVLPNIPWALAGALTYPIWDLGGPLHPAWTFAVAIVWFISVSFCVGWMAAGLALTPSTIILQSRTPLLAVDQSFALVRKSRWYLISFLGLLYLPIAMSLYVAVAPGLKTGLIDLLQSILGSEPGTATLLVGSELAKTALTLPGTIAPAVLYFHFKARARRLPPGISHGSWTRWLSVMAMHEARRTRASDAATNRPDKYGLCCEEQWKSESRWKILTRPAGLSPRT